MYPKTVCLRQFTACRRASRPASSAEAEVFACMNQPSFRHDDKEKEIKQTLTVIYDALRQKGYNPINQIVGYILSEDPTYITTYNNARSLIRRIDRDELLQILVKSYLDS